MRVCSFFIVGALAALPAAAAEPYMGDPAEGARIATELRILRPAADTNWTGVIRLSRSGKPTVEIPVSCYVFVEPTRWRSVYNTSKTTDGPAEKLEITRFTDGSTQYLYSISSTGVALPTEPEQLKGQEASIPFAGSDFYLSDLGMEFLQWPTQLLQTGQMRRGQPCYVLDSINPNPGNGAYARVRSWIPKEYFGILTAEAYDENGRLLKEFNAGSFIKDAAGNYQLKDMKIRSVPDRSRTEIRFDISK